MKTPARGFSSIIIVLVVLAVIAGAYYAYSKYYASPASQAAKSTVSGSATTTIDAYFSKDASHVYYQSFEADTPASAVATTTKVLTTGFTNVSPDPATFRRISSFQYEGTAEGNIDYAYYEDKNALYEYLIYKGSGGEQTLVKVLNVNSTTSSATNNPDYGEPPQKIIADGLYEGVDGQIYMEYADAVPPPALDVDPATFSAVSGLFYSNACYQAPNVPGCVMTTAQYFRDKNGVYEYFLNIQPDQDAIGSDWTSIDGADRATFQALSMEYSKDKNQVYANFSTDDGSYIAPITGADSSTFELVSGQKSYDARDKNHLYLNGEVVSGS